MLCLRGVSKRYGRGPWVLSGVDLDVAAGQIVAVAGDNGSGKSTLLRMLVGLSRPTTGEIAGRPAVVGYVPERFPPDERLSARSYLRHLGRVRGLHRAGAAARADELLDRLSLAGGVDTPLRLLSKGNAQKVALAQAMLVPPELLVLDEPWSGLDVAAHGELARMIEEVAAAGGAIMFTDHGGAINTFNGVAVSAGYRIAGGRLTGVVPSSAEIVVADVAVVLLESPPDLDEPDWPAGGLPFADGVLAATADDRRVTLRVAGGSVDQILLDALNKGWSVVGVRREDDRGDGRRAGR
ncbi:MAG TPA: ABC transporter ATP-binding protein [Pseudonocardiaceae bacterium]|nr:ABC transporter ATP-binding protein [Pseudonocardiaceae bacterium]